MFHLSPAEGAAIRARQGEDLSKGLGLQKTCDELLAPTFHTVSPVTIRSFPKSKLKPGMVVCPAAQLKRDVCPSPGSSLYTTHTHNTTQALAHPSTPHTHSTRQVPHKRSEKRQMEEFTKGRINPSATSSGAGPQCELHENTESQDVSASLGQ